jgi:hypothetical protein
MKFEITIYTHFDLQRSKLIPKEGKMTSILTSDVQTYVRELISKEFRSINNEEKAPSENRRSFKSEHQKQPQQSDVFGQQINE